MKAFRRLLALFIILSLAAPIVLTFAQEYTYEYGYETIDIEPSSGEPLATYIDIYLENFMPAKTVDIYFGDIKVATTRTNSTGQALIENLLLPELPGGNIWVTARISGEGVVATTTFYVFPYIELLDGSNNPVMDNTYLGDGEILRVRGYGFKPNEVIIIEDDASDERNPIAAGRVISVAKGTIEDDHLIADHKGSFDIKYTLRVTQDTGTLVEVTATGEGTDFEDASGTLWAYFTAAGPISIYLTQNEYLVEPGDEVTIYVTSFEGLRADRTYQLLLDRSRLDFLVDGVDADWFTLENDTITFTVPNMAPGVHSLAITYTGSSNPLAEHIFVISRPNTTATVKVVKAVNGSPTPETTDTIVYGGGYYLVGYNFLPNEAGVYAYMYTSSYTSYMIGSLYIRSSGAGVRYFTGPLCATGTYAIYFSRVYTPPEPILVDVVPTAEISPEEGRPGDLIELNIWGLEAGGSYVIVWDALGDPTPVPNSAFMAGQDGDRTDLWFEVPSVPEGTYAISVAPASDPTSPVDLYDQEGNVAYPEFDVRPEIEFNPAGEYIPYQLVTFSWDIGRDPDAEGEQVLITLDGTPIFNGIISPDMIQGASSSATVNWEDGVIKGSFIMPNGPPDEELELKIRAGTDTAVGTLTRVSGAGSMLLGVELANDIAYIKGKSDTIVASLSDLRVEIEDISKDVVYLRTNMGDMITTLENINAAVVSVSNDMATLRTDVGTITTKLENVASIITSSKEDIMSEIGSKTSKVLESTSVLGAKINTVSETVDSIKGTVSTIPAQISAVSDNVQSVNTEVKNITMYLYVIMSLLALAIAVTIVMGLIRR